MPIYNKYRISILSALLLIVSFSIEAQEKSKIDLGLSQHLMQCSEDEMIPLLVELPAHLIEDIREAYSIEIRLAVGDLFSIELPAKEVWNFSNEAAIKKIEFNRYKGKSLSDTMLIQTRADSLLIDNRIKSRASGKGVILGIIDSGIELNHPDFQDSSGNTRVLYVWDQGVPYNTNRQALNYNYGIEWDSAAINAGISTHDDKAAEFGHGSMVTGAAASNGLATGNFRGIAPESNLIVVATDFSKPNWLQTVAEAVDYIYRKADSLGMPCIINASVGTYAGSHDGKDIAARMIDQMIQQKNSRSFVCAAGNSGHLKYHLQHQVNSDTAFTWFISHPAQFAGQGGVYFEAWIDSVYGNSLQIEMAVDRIHSTGIDERENSNAFQLSNKVNLISRDSIFNANGQLLASMVYFVELSQGRYRLEMALINPDSSNYAFRLQSTGIGKLDLWSSYAIMQSSDMISSNLPSINQFPQISNYVLPDSLQTMVSSFTCLPSVITVANYTNRGSYISVNGQVQNTNATPGKMSPNSSLGPNREGFLKPDIASAGDFMLASGRIATMNQLIAIEPAKIAQDSMHMRNGGTSMASPTVAGMAALLLETCPGLSANQVKTALLNSSRLDAFTPNPNSFKWGAGKADAQQLLLNHQYQAILNSNDTTLCGIDSFYLSANSSYLNYKWNTGDTNAGIWVKQSGIYQLKALNQQGCFAYSDSVAIQLNANPTKANIRQNGDTLSIVSNAQIQWYFANQVISGATASTYIAQQSGLYYCLLTDSLNACTIFSDSLLHFVTGINTNNTNNIQVYPNPVYKELFISSKNQAIGRIKIINQHGQVVYENNYNQEQQIKLDFSLYPSGLYFIKSDFGNTKILHFE